jgi:hypothetical protein
MKFEVKAFCACAKLLFPHLEQHDLDCEAEYYAELANAELRRMLDAAPLVFSHYGGEEWHNHDEFSDEDIKYYTHGRVVDIKPPTSSQD